MPEEVVDAGVGLADVIGDAGGAADAGGGAGAGDGGAGAGDAGAGGPAHEKDGEKKDGAGAADDGAGGGEDDARTTETPEEKTAREAKEAEDNEEPTTSDGKKIADPETRKAIAALKKTDKEAAKKVADIYYANQEILKATGTESVRQALNTIRADRAVLSDVGGREGISNMKTELAEWNAEAQDILTGGEKTVASIGAESPEGLSMTTGSALDWLAKNKPDLYQKALLPEAWNHLESHGYFEVLDALEGFIKDGKGQEAYNVLQKLKTWSANDRNKAAGFAKERTERAKVDPKQQEYERKDAEYAQKDQQRFESDVNRELTSLNNTVLKETLGEFFREMKFGSEGKRDIEQAVMNRVWQSMKKDKRYQEDAAAILKKRDVNESASFIAAEFAQRVGDAFLKYRSANYPNYKPGKAAAPPPKKDNGATGGNNGNAGAAARSAGNGAAAGAAKGAGSSSQTPIQLRAGEMPTRAQVDWKSPNAVTNYIGGLARLTNGKWVKWAVNSRAS